MKTTGTPVFDDAHTWAVYSPGGKLLTTLEKAQEGSYWLYKAGLSGTVGPYPDRDRPMLPLGEDCERCEGTGKDRGSRETSPVDDDNNPTTIPENVDPSRELEFDECWTCKGFGVLRSTGYANPYKSAQSAKAGKAQGKAKTCKRCAGKGRICWVPIVTNCHPCSGLGKKPVWDPTRPVLPPEVERCDSATDQFMWDWLRTITITVARTNDGMTWGESHLGFMGLGSITDYGKAWESTDEEVIQQVLDSSLLSHTQFTKLIDDVTRTFGPALVIRVTRQGVTPLVAGVPALQGLGALPPTYFPAVFQEV